MDETQIRDSEKDHIALYSPLCKKCGHLDPQEPKKYIKCHISAGNKQCPAGEIVIVIVGKAYRYAQKVIEARNTRNVEAEAKLLSYVATQSAQFQERFYSALENPSEILE